MCFEDMTIARPHIKKKDTENMISFSPSSEQQQLISQAGYKLCSKRKILSFTPYQPLQPF